MRVQVSSVRVRYPALTVYRRETTPKTCFRRILLKCS